MPELEYDFRADCAKLRRGHVEINLMIARILDYYGLPRISKEEIDKALIDEGWLLPVKSSPAAMGRLSTCQSPVHRLPCAPPPIRHGEQ